MVSDDVVDAACLLRSRPAAIVASADEATVVQLVKFSCWSSKRFKRNESGRFRCDGTPVECGSVSRWACRKERYNRAFDFCVHDHARRA